MPPLRITRKLIGKGLAGDVLGDKAYLIIDGVDDAWISQEGDPRDVTLRREVRLRPGEWFFIDRPESVLVIALVDTAIAVGALPQARAYSGACAAAKRLGHVTRLCRKILPGHHGQYCLRCLMQPLHEHSSAHHTCGADMVSPLPVAGWLSRTLVPPDERRCIDVRACLGTLAS